MKDLICVHCLGLIILSIVSMFISLNLWRKYFIVKNKFTHYLAIYFGLAGIGWAYRFSTIEWMFNNEESVMLLIKIIAIFPQVILLVFILAFYDIARNVRYSILFISIVLYAIGLIYIVLFVIMTLIINILNIVLFLRNWLKNRDLKSLGFSIGLIFIFIGGTLSNVDNFYNGIFMILAAVTWAITFSSAN